jgi:D-cysteine desulfhydrase
VDVPRIALGQGPTPVRRLRSIGEDVWMKNDGVYGGVYGGNKARKLEYVLADVIARKKTTILTIGGTGTNHGLATTLYAAQHGIRTVLLLVDQPETEAVRAQLLRLARAGAVIHRTHGTARTIAALPWYMARHGWPYFLMVGASNAVGTVGYVRAGIELGEQVARGELPEPAEVVVAMGSGGTAAGLMVGLAAAGLRTKVRAVAVTEQFPFRTAALAQRLARQAARLVGAPPGRLAELVVETGFVGDGYGHVTAEAEAAKARLGEAEGLVLESVYTGKAMAALLALRARGAFGGKPVLYWHTYNAIALPAALAVAA